MKWYDFLDSGQYPGRAPGPTEPGRTQNYKAVLVKKLSLMENKLIKSTLLHITQLKVNVKVLVDL